MTDTKGLKGQQLQSASHSPIISVMPDEMAFTTGDSTTYQLLTQITNVCSGIAVLHKGYPSIGGMMHIYSSQAMGTMLTQEQIAEKVHLAWEKFSTRMDELATNGQTFEAFLFGARTK